MPSLRDHFQILGLTEEASLEDALASYKDLIRVWHPDRFGHDGRLRRKAEEHTSRLNVAMAEVREFFKNPSAPRYRAEPTRQERRAPPPSARVTPSLGMSLAVHQRTNVSFTQFVWGALLLYLGWYLSIEHQGSTGRVALGIALSGYGFSTALVGVTLLCFKRPFIYLTNSSVSMLGSPSIPIGAIASSHIVVTPKGSLFTLQASPAYVRASPLPLRLWLHLRYLLRRTHYEVRASSLDTHPALIIRTMELLAAQDAVHPQAPHQPSNSWGYYAALLSVLVLAVPAIRILAYGTLPPSSILPYIVLFALLRTFSVITTVVLAPQR
ncbi:MAG: hypothetical protein RL518_1691 [Pseudomonadota bacterium]|jgi:hypothetical protein